MGSWNSLEATIEKTFDLLDYSKAGHLTRAEVCKHWNGPFRKTYTDILFREIDLNSDGVIHRGEWKAYWKLLRKVGYTRREVFQCLKSIQSGRLTLDLRFSYYERLRRRQSLIQEIMVETSKM